MKGNFEKLDIEIYGESHAEVIGVKLCGLPKGEAVTDAAIFDMLQRRKSSADVWSTARRENDCAQVLHGVENGVTDGGVFEAQIVNSDVKASDYVAISSLPRPSHADYVAFVRDGEIPSGGGRFSGRMTAPLCIAGAVAKSILSAHGVRIYAYTSSIFDVELGSYKSGLADENTLNNAKNNKLACLISDNAESAIDAISAASKNSDSVGGTIECVCLGLPVGKFGDALFEGLEGKIAYSVFAVPAVKGIEFGAGFGFASMRGSEANDALRVEEGKIVTSTNNNGGINGGISNGMPLTLRVAIKPTPSIAKPQKTVNLETLTDAEISVRGRHDACIVPRAVPCVESAVAIAILDEALKRGIV